MYYHESCAKNITSSIYRFLFFQLYTVYSFQIRILLAEILISPIVCKTERAEIETMSLKLFSFVFEAFEQNYSPRSSQYLIVSTAVFALL